MTAALLDRATTRPTATRQTRRPARPKLRVLDQAASRRRARHRSALLILFVAVLAGFFAVAFVHAELVAGQHELDAVRTDISQAEARHAELARAVEEASAPGVIVTRATELGMVRTRQPVYLTAAAPVRSIEVGLPMATESAPAADVDGATITQVAASSDPASAGSDDGDRLIGSLGGAGGISAAVKIPATATLALGAGSFPAGATTATAQPTDQTSAVAAAPLELAQSTETTIGGQTSDGAGIEAPSGPVSSVAGTRAVSSPVAATASSTVAVTSTVAATSMVAPATTEPLTAGGLASAAATTSG